MVLETRARARAIDKLEQDCFDVAVALSNAAASPLLAEAAPLIPAKPLIRKAKPLKPVKSPTKVKGARKVHSIAKLKRSNSRKQHNGGPLIVKLAVKYYNIGSKVLREKYGIKIMRPKVAHTNKDRFKLGHNPYVGTSLPILPEDEALRIYDLLVEHNRRFGFGSFVNQPAHATQLKSVVTIDSIIQVMLSQTTANELAIDTHDRLRNRYVYVVNGKKYAGKIPNWHQVRLLPEEDLRDALVPGGQFNKRAKAIKELLDYVYNANVERRSVGKGRYDHVGSPPGAKDFFDGMLSMEFITADFDDDSDQAVLDRLLKLPNFGPKSAMCILAFELRRDLFVVDVHVLRFCKWLGWIPKTANPEDAAMYLHKVIPKHIRYDFHNQIWTHCATENVREARGRLMVCPFCGSNPPPSGKDFSKVECLLEPYLPRLEKRWSRGYQPKRENPKDATKIKDEQDEAELSTVVVGVENPVVLREEIQQSDVSISAEIDVRKLRPSSNSGSKDKESSSSSGAVVRGLPVKEKKPKVRRTMLMDELSPEQAKALNKYLFMFRPLDNSFGQDRGTFESKPRFRWEGPEIMDPDVAVPYEDAVKILKGELPHPWMRPTEEDLIKQQVLCAMAPPSAPLPTHNSVASAIDETDVEEVEWEATEDEMDGDTLVDSMDEETWEDRMDEDDVDERIGEEMRTWQIDNLE